MQEARGAVPPTRPPHSRAPSSTAIVEHPAAARRGDRDVGGAERPRVKIAEGARHGVRERDHPEVIPTPSTMPIVVSNVRCAAHASCVIPESAGLMPLASSTGRDDLRRWCGA